MVKNGWNQDAALMIFCTLEKTRKLPGVIVED